MRIKIKFSPVNSIFKIPVNYNYLVQSFIYKNISNKLSDFLHNKGYTDGKRSFKMFTFSRLQGKCHYDGESKSLIFKDNFDLWVSSPESDFLESYASELLKNPEIRLGENQIYINSIEVSITPPFEEEILIKMISPVTVYRTLPDMEGNKTTYYLHPKEAKFSELIYKNLKKKYRAFYKSEPPHVDFEIEPERVSDRSLKIIYYEKKGAEKFLIKGWLGVYKIKSHPEILKLAWDAGIGSKNPQGFGMFEIVNGESGIASRESEMVNG